MTQPWQTLLDERLPDADRVMVVEVGSTAHGTALDGTDDFDICAVWIEGPNQVLTWQQAKGTAMYRTQPEGVRSGPGDVDAQVYTLRKFLGLAVAGNPSILQTLWCPVLEDSETAAELRNIREWFIGRHILNPYRGYMKSQVQRILGTKGSGHGTRGSGGRVELIEAHGYDTKYAMHAARLGFQCLELLNTYGLELPMTSEAGDWLRAVRRGEVPFQDWFDRVIALDRLLGEAFDWVTIPEKPQTKDIEDWCVDMHLGSWGA